MSDRYVIVVDAGSTRIRCLVFGSNGDVAAERSALWSYVQSGELSPYVRELDADAVWESTAQLIAECVGDVKVDAHRIAAITVTSQRQGVVFLDNDGHVLYAGPNTDLRAVFEGAAIDEAMGERVFEVTGRLPSFLFTFAKLRWFKQHRPNIYDRIERVATLADWLRWKLSGELVSEATLAAEAGLLDIRERRWCEELFEELGVRTPFGVPIEKAGNGNRECSTRSRGRHRASGGRSGRRIGCGYAVRASWTRSEPCGRGRGSLRDGAYRCSWSRTRPCTTPDDVFGRAVT